MLAEYAKLSREAADGNEDYEQYLLRLSELEVATRSANALTSRIKQAWKGARKTPTRGWGEGRGKCPHWIAGLSVGLPMAARSRQTGDAYSDGLS